MRERTDRRVSADIDLPAFRQDRDLIVAPQAIWSVDQEPTFTTNDSKGEQRLGEFALVSGIVLIAVSLVVVGALVAGALEFLAVSMAGGAGCSSSCACSVDLPR